MALGLLGGLDRPSVTVTCAKGHEPDRQIGFSGAPAQIVHFLRAARSLRPNASMAAAQAPSRVKRKS